MRIAIFTDTFLPQLNGVVTSVLGLAHGLADRGHTVHIIAPKFRKNPKLSHPNITIHRIKSIPAFFYEDFKFSAPFSHSVLRVLKKSKIDVIHFHTPLMLGLNAIFLSRILRVPLVGTFHTFFADPQYLLHVNMDYRIIQRLAWKYSNWYYNQCDLVTAPSQTTVRVLKKYKCTSPMKCISNGINTKIFDNTNASKVRKRYGKNLLLYIGRIAHEKNIPYLLDCFKLIIKKLPSAQLLLVGTGPQIKDITHKIARERIPNVHILGKVEHSNLVKSGLFGACDLFVTASKTENQPMTILEAQANGMVCIGVNKGGIPDLIHDNLNGFVVDSEDKQAFAEAVVKVLTTKGLHRKMQKATMEMVQKHELPSVLETWEQTYSKLIERINQKA